MSFLPQLTKGGHSRPEPSTKPAVGVEHGKVTNRSSRLLLLLLLPDCSRHPPPHTHTHFNSSPSPASGPPAWTSCLVLKLLGEGRWLVLPSDPLPSGWKQVGGCKSRAAQTWGLSQIPTKKPLRSPPRALELQPPPPQDKAASSPIPPSRGPLRNPKAQREGSAQ